MTIVLLRQATSHLSMVSQFENGCCDGDHRPLIFFNISRCAVSAPGSANAMPAPRTRTDAHQFRVPFRAGPLSLPPKSAVLGRNEVACRAHLPAGEVRSACPGGTVVRRPRAAPGQSGSDAITCIRLRIVKRLFRSRCGLNSGWQTQMSNRPSHRWKLHKWRTE